MNELLLILTWLTPLFATIFALGRLGSWQLSFAAVPALLTALLLPAGSQLDISWLLLGSQFGLDESGRIFLIFTALLWLCAGLQTELTMRDDPHLKRFRLFYLLAMAGNFWLIVGQDLVSYFLGFALMGLAAYGLVIHRGDPASLRAGRVYLVMTLIAEVALFAALLMIFRHTDTLAPTPAQIEGSGDWLIGLLIFSLGIKAGLVLLHVWLPLAHPAAPVPASAVLSGTMIKAALIGWMRFLPLGHEALWDWGNVMTTVGTVTVLYAIPVGLVQTNPKVVLAYSSVGKMGLMTAILGLALMAPALMPVIITTLTFYAAHHGLAKGALFLGVGVVQGTNTRWMLLILAIPALVLAGAPFTSGAMVKALVKPSLAEIVGMWADAVQLLLVTSTIGTTLLMARFLVLMRTVQSSAVNATVWIATPWIVLIGVILATPFLSGFSFPSPIDSWPFMAGAGLAFITALLGSRWGKHFLGCIPAGDVIELYSYAARRLWLLLRLSSFKRLSMPIKNVKRTVGQLVSYQSLWKLSLEQNLRLWPVAGTLALGLCGALLFMLWVES